MNGITVTVLSIAAFSLPFLAGPMTETSPTDSRYLSPSAIVADKGGSTLYIAEITAKQVVQFDLVSEKIRRTFPLPDPPGGIALSHDGEDLYVTGAATQGKVHVVGLAGGRIKHSISVGHTPTDLLLSPDGKRLYVCNRFTSDISVVDVKDQTEIQRIPVTREPVSVALDNEGETLFVANQIPNGASDGNYNAAEVSVVDTRTNKVVDNIQLLNGSMGLREIDISPDGLYAYVTQILARYQLPTTQLERGWMNTNAVSIIDVKNHSLLNTILLDDVEMGAANPWAVDFTHDGQFLCVTTAGTHELIVIDRVKLHRALAELDDDSASDVPNDFSFLVDLKRRIGLPGNGPRGLAVIGSHVYITEYFSDSLASVDLTSISPRSVRSLSLGPTKAADVRRKGERLFHDAQHCFQKWQSCSTCHPNEGRVDAINWDLMNDGIGNPKNTKSLLLSHRTPPAMSSGKREDGRTAVRAGIRFIQFAVRPEAEAEAIDTYLDSLEPVPSPWLVNGKLSDSALRGKEVFGKADCGSCHPAPLFTDLNSYEIGTGRGLDTGKGFDTPTLIEVWRTAPYLHDGRAASIKDALTGKPDGISHGNIEGLSEGQLSDLVEYILSL